MKFAGLLILLAFGCCLFLGARSGRMTVKWFPDAERETNPVYFWSVVALYMLFVVFGIWILMTQD
ncbi:hypothetical protein [Sphingomonas yabuuchiae]|uniref:hypothetical protein n=1 Tax=Sphingomonas yabuuchiae TaxID=172044 RepID=UPI003D981D48